MGGSPDSRRPGSLSRPDGDDPATDVTVYQRGWRLGGKGASSRGIHGRIEEHGLHVWLGYYENAFRLVRECYEELDRPHRIPDAPITTWDEAFRPASTIGLGELHDGEWLHWLAEFDENPALPGDARRRPPTALPRGARRTFGEAPPQLRRVVAEGGTGRLRRRCRSC